MGEIRVMVVDDDAELANALRGVSSHDDPALSIAWSDDIGRIETLVDERVIDVLIGATESTLFEGDLTDLLHIAQPIPVVAYGEPTTAGTRSGKDGIAAVVDPIDDEAIVRLARSVLAIGAGTSERRTAAESATSILEAIMESIDRVVITVSDEYTVTRWNRAVLNATGRDRNSMQGRSVLELVGAAYREDLQRTIDRAIETGEPASITVSLTRGAGEFVETELVISALAGTSEICLVGRPLEDRDGRIEALRQLHGTMIDLLRVQSPEDAISTATGTLVDLLDCRYVGGWRAIDRTLRPVVVAGDILTTTAALEPIAETAVPFDRLKEGPITMGPGEEPVASLVPVDIADRALVLGLDRHGIIVVVGDGFDARDENFASIVTTMTVATIDRVHREADLVRKSERLEEFVSTVSHDLRNPLAVASGYLEQYKDSNDPTDLETVEDGIDHAQSIIEDLLAQVRGRGKEPVDLDLNVIAETAWNTVETGETTLEMDGSRRFTGEDTRVQQLFANAFRNAIEHGDASTITVRSTDTGFAIEDDGVGIDPADRDRVIDTGYTTADAGTGLGLSIISRIAEDHGWTLELGESATGGVSLAVDLAPDRTGSEKIL